MILPPINGGFKGLVAQRDHRSGIDQMSHFLSIPNVFVSAIFRLITNCTREMTQPESTIAHAIHADVYCYVRARIAHAIPLASVIHIFYKKKDKEMQNFGS